MGNIFTTAGKRRNKTAFATNIFGVSQAAVATIDHDLHRQRRNAFARFFSKDSVRRVEPIIRAALKDMFTRIETDQGLEQPVTLSLVFSAFTSEIITQYCFGRSPRFLHAPDLNKQFFDMMIGVHEMGAMARQFSWLMPLLDALPQWLTLKLDPGTAKYYEHIEVRIPPACR